MVDQKFCHAFQVGACTRGEACRYAHKLDPNFKRKACAHFAKNKCNRGKDCKFSHAKEDIDLLKATSGASVPGGTSAGASGSVSTATTEAQFKQWRYNIPIPDASRGKTRPLGGPAMSNFCKQALALVSGEAGLMQEVISLLASEGGSQRLTEVVDQGFEGLNEAQTAHIFDAQILPFFQAISHKNVLASVIMNGRVMTIYNIIYGGDGQRVVSLFAAVTRHLQSLQLLDAENSQVANLQSVLAIETSLAVLHKLIEVNTEAQVHDGLKLVGETFSTILEEPLPETAAFAFKPAQKCLRRIEQRLGLGQALPESKDYVKTVGHRATFELARELPGELSEDGPRHDNDNVDIRRISILPTVQEIQSSRTEYLPPADPRKWHIGGLRGLLDRHFRLLREDTVGQLRDAAKFELERLQNPRPQDGNNRREHQGARTFVYENVTLSDLAFDAYGGMEFVLSFDQPKDLHSKSEDEHREWWQSSKRLGYEALICLLSSEGSVTFFVVSRVPMKKKKKDDEDTDTVQLHKQYNLWSNQERANVIAKPVEQSDVHALLDKLLHSNTEQYSLVEFPGILLPAFRPTLQAMQRLSDSLDVPFPEILAPISTPANPSREAAIDLPAYAMKPGFRFNLSGVTEPGFNLHLTPAQNMDAMAEELAIYSTLDPGQAQAVVSSLSRSLALIQGPPGTGKSYTGVQLIKILLDNRAAGELGPLICVCYTNHALDQGLERLVDEGVKHVVRIGGSSKSERLAEVNLRAVTQRLDLTKTEKGDRWSLWKNIEAEAEEINRILSQIRQLGAEDAVAAHLEMHNPKHYENLFGGEDEDGWQISGRHRGSVLDSWLKSAAWGQGRPRSVDVLQDVHVGNMTGFERRILHQSWLDNIQEDLQDMLRRALSEYNRVKQQHDLISTELDLRVLRQANIIGITTSGLAKNLDLIRRTGAKVLVCEEAGEVLESHLLTALLPTVEHAILIGDHQQLRPHIQNHDLSSESKSGLQYSFDVSLFERLVQPRDILAQPLPYCTLSVQRRMHPSISQLVRKTLYPQLEDAPSVMSYPNVVGMRQRLFWMHHEHKENGAEGAISMSHTNDFEVGMVASLVTHLVHQGIYASDEIAVITLYLGQLRKIRNKLGSTFNIVLNERDVEDLQKQADTDPDDGELVIEKLTRPSSIARGTLLQALRVATVDNFQGEEAKVIIISLVRSNAKNNPGFLKTSNRINVLLSRAKHGMYIIGNSNTTSNVEMWSAVLDIFRGDGNFGNALELCCPRHEATPLSVSTPEDFIRLSPEAGCDLACDKQLSCGHACMSKCHSQLLHNAVHCMKPCTRPKAGCTHNCQLPCGDPCYKQCQEIVNVEVELSCGHCKTSLPCYQDQDHSKALCETPVEQTVPGCSHTIMVPCHIDVGLDYVCSAVCGDLLPCGHQCQKPCHECRNRNDDGTINAVEHGQCKQPCGRNYSTCRHHCKASCHNKDPCPLCQEKCDVRCIHAACDKKCHEPCAPCAEEQCGSRCRHSRCSMPCAAPCDWVPCSLRCDRMLACGCQCPSVCGEPCPDATFCQNCATGNIKSMTVDFIMFETYADINLDDNPCIFTACGHIFTIGSMDGIMDMPKHYVIDTETDKPRALKTSSEPFSSGELKVCPACRSSLRSVARYGRIVRRALLDESAKKLTAWSNSTHATLEERLAQDQEKLLVSLDRSRKPGQDLKLLGQVSEQVKAVKRLSTVSRYQKIIATRNKIQAFAKKLGKDEQPYQRVRNLVETVRRQHQDSSMAEFDFSSAELQLREHLQATSLLVRCEIILLSDVVSMHDKTPAGRMKGTLQIDFTANRTRCDLLVKEAQSTQNFRQAVEGDIFWARFAAMECGNIDATAEGAQPGALHVQEVLNKAGFDRLDSADKVCKSFVGKDVNPTKGLKDEIVDVRRMLNKGVSTSEMKMVVAAMAREFSGTGHWYRCVNGHPFTVGECGMPMQLARCPACGAGIGGQNHQATAGVEHARDIEEDFGNMHL